MKFFIVAYLKVEFTKRGVTLALFILQHKRDDKESLHHITNFDKHPYDGFIILYVGYEEKFNGSELAFVPNP